MNFFENRLRIRLGRLSTAISCLLSIFLALTSSPGQTTSRENLLPALTFSMTKYVDWPDTPRAAEDEPILFIGVHDSDDWFEAFRALDGKAVKGKTTKVVHLKNGMDPDDLRRCQVIFTTDPAVLAKLSAIAKRGEALLVTDIDSAAKSGKASVQFVPNGTKIGFEVCLDFVKASNLRMSSAVLKLAKEVYRSD